MEQFHFTDPTFSDNTRCVFDIPTRLVDACDPDIRLANIGALFTADPDPAKAQACSYPSNLGVKACIRNATLFLNDQMVEQLRSVGNYMGMTNLATSNGKALDIDGQLEKSWRAYTAISDRMVNYDKLTFASYKHLQQNSDTYADMSKPSYGCVSLLDFFNSLNALLKNSIMIYSKYVAIRIEIEWETDISAYTVGNAGGAVNFPTNSQLTFSKPVLITKRYNNPALLDELEKVYSDGFSLNYTSMISERVNLNQVTVANLTTLINSNKFTLKSVTGKKVVKAIVQTTMNVLPSDLITEGSIELGSKYYSVGNNNEVLKINLNSAQMIPYNGIDTPALKRLYRNIGMGEQKLQLVQMCDVANYKDAVALTMNSTNIQAQTFLQSYYVIPFGTVTVDNLSCEYQCYSSDQLPKDATQVQTWIFEVARKMSINTGVITLSFL